tara:strand:+ start:110 stop:334 length:225 start_codon:yes stop_codon:yes gene_type:complete
MEKKYCIIPTEDIDNINFTKVLENKSTIRYSIDNTKFIVKYIGEKPTDLDSFTSYTHTEIIEIINDPANGWINE